MDLVVIHDLSFDNDADEEEEAAHDEEYVGSRWCNSACRSLAIYLSSTMPRARQTVEWEGKFSVPRCRNDIKSKSIGQGRLSLVMNWKTLAVRHPEWYRTTCGGSILHSISGRGMLW